MEHAINLFNIRLKYDAWITEDISNSLKYFEKAVHRMGIKTSLSKRTNLQDVKQKQYMEADKLWDQILGNVMDKNKTPDENVAVESVKKKIRDILGIEKLTCLRGELINKAFESLEKNA